MDPTRAALARRRHVRPALAGAVLLTVAALVAGTAAAPPSSAAPARAGQHPPATRAGDRPQARKDAPARRAARGKGCGGHRPRKAGGGRWVCTFSDAFNGHRLKPRKWGVVRTRRTGYQVGGECFVDSPRTVRVRHGRLRLTVRRTKHPFTCKSPGGDYRSQAIAGSVTTMRTFGQAYGRYVIRARFPDVTEPGVHSALWLYPRRLKMVSAFETDYGEIDIGEYYSRYPDRVIPMLHYHARILSRPVRTNQNCLVEHPDRFHTYQLVWTPDRIVIRYDGKLCLKNTDWAPVWPMRHPAPFDKPFALLLTQALGTRGNAYRPGRTQLPATMVIGYVRVWK